MTEALIPLPIEEDLFDMDDVSKSVVHAMDGLPLQARQEFVKNILFDNGGSRGSYPYDDTLIIATDVIEDAVNLLNGDDRGGRMFEQDDTHANCVTKSISHAMDDLPLLERLEFAKNIICNRGGARGTPEADDTLIVAVDVFARVIKLVKENKALACARQPYDDVVSVFAQRSSSPTPT